jgi:hypothetical protein
MGIRHRCAWNENSLCRYSFFPSTNGDAEMFSRIRAPASAKAPMGLKWYSGRSTNFSSFHKSSQIDTPTG